MEKKKMVNLDMKQYGMFLALVAIYLIFAILIFTFSKIIVTFFLQDNL